MEIVEATGHVLEAGKSSELTALLATVADATAMDGEPRFAPKTCHDLARAIVCRKYATGILQLCHLVNAVDACGSGKDRWERFFFGIDKVKQDDGEDCCRTSKGTEAKEKAVVLDKRYCWWCKNCVLEFAL